MTELRPWLPPGWRLVHLATVPSTNDEAAACARSGEPGRLAVWADSQTTGRGRRGRAWSSPIGNLAVSLMERPDLPMSRAAEGGFVAALAVRDALLTAGVPGERVRLKWPNDVLLDDAKVAGILLEASAKPGGERVDWLVVGIGINLRAHPPDTRYPATDLESAGFEGTGPAEVLEALLAAWNRRRHAWTADGFDAVRAGWREAAAHLGVMVRVDTGAELVEGRFVDLAVDGSLVVELPGGDRRRFLAGDVRSFPSDDGG